MTGLNNGIDVLKQRGLIALGQRCDGVIKQRLIGNPQKRARDVVGQTIRSCTCEKLIQNRQSITRGTTTGGNHHWVDGVFHEDAL